MSTRSGVIACVTAIAACGSSQLPEKRAAVAAPSTSVAVAVIASAQPEVPAVEMDAPRAALHDDELADARAAVERIRNGAAESWVVGMGDKPASNAGICASASPVPATIPTSGAAIETASSSWSGSDTTGWRCLHFARVTPLRFQLTYAQGGHYKSPARGGHDPGPNGFEACAEADFVPGGKTTLVCATARLDLKSKRITDDERFIADDEFIADRSPPPSGRADDTAKEVCDALGALDAHARAWETPVAPGSADACVRSLGMLDAKTLRAWSGCARLSSTPEARHCFRKIGRDLPVGEAP